MKTPKEKAECKRCGYIMNIPKSYADLCYDCSPEVE